jgi:probable HAF family extracellular repeat protein
MPVALHDYHAFIYADGAVSDLNDLIPPDSGVTLEAATAINNAGQIVGYTFTGGVDPKPHAFLLTPDDGGLPRDVSPGLLRLSSPVPEATEFADITNPPPVSTPREPAPAEARAALPAGTAAHRATDAVLAELHRTNAPAPAGTGEIGSRSDVVGAAGLTDPLAETR